MKNTKTQNPNKDQNPNRELPMVSVIVVTFNRGTVIIPCIESLKGQDYPKDRYEIIVVDDHSTDNTARIVEEQGVHIIRHDANRGIPAARNTGLAAAKGTIIAYTDDDATANQDWLKNLVIPFGSPEITASGGRTFAYKTDRLAERYLAAVEYGNPAPLGFGKNKNPLWRFFVYLKGMFTPVTIATQPIEVQAVFGLNCAFRADALRATGGFDEKLLADEDSEICTRLRGMGARIIFTPAAVVHHRHREKISYLILQTYRRSQYTVYYYAKEKKVLPIFPLPILYSLLAIFLVIFYPALGITFVILGPLLLYSWWPIRAFRTSHAEYFIYGYIQLALEAAALLGMARGEFKSF